MIEKRLKAVFNHQQHDLLIFKEKNQTKTLNSKDCRRQPREYRRSCIQPNTQNNMSSHIGNIYPSCYIIKTVYSGLLGRKR